MIHIPICFPMSDVYMCHEGLGVCPGVLTAACSIAVCYLEQPSSNTMSISKALTEVVATPHLASYKGCM